MVHNYGMHNRRIALKVPLLFLALVLAAHLALFASIRLYPFLDMPNHLALATIYRYFNKPGNLFSSYFHLNLFPRPNVFHMVLCGSDIFPSVEAANRIFFCLYIVLFAGTAVLILRRLGGNMWYALLVPLLFYNCSVSYGFVGCTIAIPFVLMVIYCMLRDAEGAGGGNLIAIAFLLTGLFFMHALMACFGMFVFVCWVLWQYRRAWRQAGIRLVCVIPVGILLGLWWLKDTAAYKGMGMQQAVIGYYQHMYIRHFPFRAGFLIHDNFRCWGGVAGYAVALAFSFFIIAALVLPFWRYRSLQRPDARAPKSPIVVLFICAFLSVLVFPDQLPGYSFLFERFSVFVMLSLIFLGSIYAASQCMRIFPVLAVVACVMHFGIWADSMRSFNRENEGFTPELFKDMPCQILGGLIYDYRFRGVSAYDNFTDYFIVWRKGIATTRTIDERSFPVQRAVDERTLPPYLEWVGKYGHYDGRYRNLDCILVRGEIPERDRPFFDGYRLVRSSGLWKIYQRTASNEDLRSGCLSNAMLSDAS